MKHNPKVERISLKPHWLIAHSLPKHHYWDAYRMAFDSSARLELDQLPQLFFKAMPVWFKGLLVLRETVARSMGLKTAHNMNVSRQLETFAGKVGDSIALFEVLDRTEEEILTGADDKHLDFRLSFIVESLDDITRITLTTTVMFNSLLGRLYFVPVKPVHKIIVPIILKRMQRLLPR